MLAHILEGLSLLHIFNRSFINAPFVNNVTIVLLVAHIIIHVVMQCVSLCLMTELIHPQILHKIQNYAAVSY
jgi:hypothetical protein